MVKSLDDELTQILDYVENANLTEFERARSILVSFCRGLVCGIRCGKRIQSGKPELTVNEELLNKFEPEWDEAKVKCREELRRSCCEKSRLHPVDECNRSMMGKTPLED